MIKYSTLLGSGEGNLLNNELRLNNYTTQQQDRADKCLGWDAVPSVQKQYLTWSHCVTHTFVTNCMVHYNIMNYSHPDMNSHLKA